MQTYRMLESLNMMPLFGTSKVHKIAESKATGRSRLPLVVHPFLFAIWPMEKVWNNCIGNYMPEQWLVIFAFLMLTASAIMLISWWRLKDVCKAGILTSLVFGTCYLWVPFSEPFTFLIKDYHIDESLVAIVYLLLCINTICLALKRLPARTITGALNIYATIIVAAGLYMAIINELQINQTAQRSMAAIKAKIGPVHLTCPSKPDIYYILVDAYANQHTLKDLYGYDSTLVRHLEKKGFTICDKTVCNYDRTMLSIPSSLNMTYFDGMLEKSNVRYGSEVYFRMLQSSAASDILSKEGYRFINVSSGWEPTDFDPFADDNPEYGPGCNLQVILLRLTVISAFEDHTHLMANLYRSSRLRLYKDLNAIKDMRSPKFVFAHTLLCHPPFFLDSEGRVTNISSAMMNEPYTKKAYITQLRFAEKELNKLIDSLLADPNYHPIIIVQSDHGSGCLAPAFNSEYANERMRILNAIYVSGSQEKPPDNISAVNIFRWLFNNYFNAGLAMLPTKAYMSVPFEDWTHPKDCVDLITFPESVDEDAHARKPIRNNR